jgi:putative ABC transport system permease protein
VSGWLSDIRQAARALRRSPGFTAVAAATLALGIGFNTAVFTVIEGVLLSPLPYARPGSLLTLRWNLSPPELEDVINASRTFSAAGGSAIQPLALTGVGDPELIQGALVSGDLFGALGVHAQVGRALAPGDDRDGGAKIAVVAYGLWQRRFGGDPSVVGRSITLAGESYTVVGVLPRSFELPEQKAEVFLPVHVGYPAAAGARGVHFLRTVFRLRDGAKPAAARADLAAIFQRMAAIHPDEDTGLKADLIPLRDEIVGATRTPLILLWGAVGLVLLIACVNLANLLLARTTARRVELAVRSALGARRGRLMRQNLTESILVALLGGGAGLTLSVAGTGPLLARLPSSLPRAAASPIDGNVLLFTFAATLATALLFGFVPAWRASGGSAAGTLAGARSTSGAGSRRLGRALVVGEIAVALTLLVGAGLLLRALWRLEALDPGFREDGLVTAHIELPESRYKDLPAQTLFRRRLLEALDAAPGAHAAMVSEVPLGGSALDHDFLIEGWPPIPVGREPSLYTRSVMGDYLRTMGIPLVAGRGFTQADQAGAPLVGIVNESMARRYFAGTSPLGARIRWARQPGEPQWITIVGVAADVRHFGLAQGERPAIYTPYAQLLEPWKRWMDVVLRAPGGGAARLLRSTVHEIDPLLPVGSIRPLGEIVSSSLARPRFLAELLGLFAAAALLLAVVGIAAVMWTLVGDRTREIGLRVALGAPPGRVLAEVLADGAKLAALGIGIGLAGSLAASHLLTGLLYAVRPTDAATYAWVAALLAVAALAACGVPALRAARIDPLDALRQE